MQLKTVRRNIIVLWGVTTGVGRWCRSFGGTCCLHLQFGIFGLEGGDAIVP